MTHFLRHPGPDAEAATDDDNNNNSMTTIIIIAVVAAIAVLAVVAGLGYYVWKRRRSSNNANTESVYDVSRVASSSVYDEDSQQSVSGGSQFSTDGESAI